MTTGRKNEISQEARPTETPQHHQNSIEIEQKTCASGIWNSANARSDILPENI
jgi:hypothetical protein